MDALVNEKRETLELPSPDAEVLPGIKWGRFDQLFTPAFWFSQAWHAENRDRITLYRLGDTLLEEMVACLLGGHGMRAEVGLAAFHRLKGRGLLQYPDSSEAAIFRALVEPLSVHGGKQVKYRYPSQRARFIANAIKRLYHESAPVHSDLALRSWLQGFDGVGPKTASWITRNLLDSDNVAIIDIHVFRAGVLIGIFDPKADVSRHYSRLESRLVALAQAMQVRLASLDTLIWGHMRHLASLAIKLISAPTRDQFS
jgi:thermostable 8-oxoguanine DNA glycosylase